MANRKWINDHFSNTLKRERDKQEWSQAELAKRMSDKGIDMHWTTIAKVEKGERSVRIDEAAAFADVFGVSVDMLLGRRARPKSDLAHALRTALDTGQQAAWQVSALKDMLRERVAELSETDTDGLYADLAADLDRGCDQLAKANQALITALRDRPRGKVIKVTTEMLARAAREQFDKEESDDS